jgi:hypothetical protein
MNSGIANLPFDSASAGSQVKDYTRQAEPVNTTGD